MLIVWANIAQIMEHLSGEEDYPHVPPRVRVDAAPVGAGGHAGGVLLTRTAEITGLSAALQQALAPWRKPLARHDPAKVLWAARPPGPTC